MQTQNQNLATDLAAFMRPPAQVMRLARMGSAHPMRLSFLRVLMRRAQREGWRFDRTLWDIDAHGVGRAVYRVTCPRRTYSLVAFSHDLPPEMRSDRVIATAWDATFALFDGEPDMADLDRLQRNVPLQEAGRISERELSLSRANRSVRLFAHVVDRLAAGLQPDRAEIDAVGYLMRTTAVYGSGKFGAADRHLIADRPEFAAPFQAEMLNVWLTRCFTIDIAEHLARVQGGARAVALAPELRLRLGVGNSTGLGMAPFLVRHPILLNNWIIARETALARVRALPCATSAQVAHLRQALADARANAGNWHSEHPIQVRKLGELRADLARIQDWLDGFPAQDEHPWDALWRRGEAELGLEGQEALLALMLEPHGDLVDDLADTMSAAPEPLHSIDGRQRVRQLREALARHYDWALRLDFSDPRNVARFWYVSEEKLEPRIGSRCHEPGAELEQPLCIARMAAELDAALAVAPADQSVAAFLLAHPEHRIMVRRAQLCARHPYAEIHDNLIGDDLLPIDMMRCKLAFFGASHFDPRSDKWVRISLFQNEPFPPGLMEPLQAGEGTEAAAVAPLAAAASDAGASETSSAAAMPRAAAAPDAGALDTAAEFPAVQAGNVDPAGQGPEDRAGRHCLSCNETEALVAKAARGAGLSWGLAAEAGRSAGWLVRRGLDGASAALALLDHLGAVPREDVRPERTPDDWRAHGDASLCPIWLGTALLDEAGSVPLDDAAPLRLSDVAQPLLLVPFLAELSAWGGNLTLRAGGLSIGIGPEGLSGDLAAFAALERADLDIMPPGSTKAESPHLPRIGGEERDSATIASRKIPLPAVSRATIAALNVYAMRTTVPASDVSRRGAGAAGDDND